MKVRDKFLILGIGMSLAFDTIDRSKLLTELHNIIDEDRWRMVKLLLELQTWITTAHHKATLIPVLFIVYLDHFQETYLWG